MPTTRKVILYIAMSLDGYIAKPNDNLDFLKMVEEKGEDYGYGDFICTIDTVIIGRKTYDWVLTQVPEFPHANEKTFVITRTPRTTEGNIIFYSNDLKDLIHQLKSEPGKNIFIDGGAEIVNILLKDRLIDEFYISIIPILLGEGVRLFKDGRPEQTLKLIETKSFQKGLVQLHYERTS